MEVRGLVDEDTAHAESCCFIVLRPGGISRDLGVGFLQGPVAIVHANITYSVDIWVGVEPVDFPGVVGVGGGDVARATVGIDDDQELERGVSLDSVWFNLFPPCFLLRLDLFSDLRCIQRGPGLLCQWIDVQRHNHRRLGRHLDGPIIKTNKRQRRYNWVVYLSLASGAMGGLFYIRAKSQTATTNPVSNEFRCLV